MPTPLQNLTGSLQGLPALNVDTPFMIPLNAMDFPTGQETFAFNSDSVLGNRAVKYINYLWVDLSNYVNDFFVISFGAYRFVLPTLSQGYYAIFSQSPFNFNFSSLTGSGRGEAIVVLLSVDPDLIFWNTQFGAGGGGGGGGGTGVLTWNPVVTGTADGSNPTFTLPTIVTKGAVIVVNGVTQKPGVAYSIIGNTITFVAPYIPFAGAIVECPVYQ